MTSLLTDHIFKPSLENMQHQKPDFFNELTDIIREYKNKNIDKQETETAIDKCIFKYVGLKIVTTIDNKLPFPNAGIETAEFDKAHIFWEEWVQKHDEFNNRMKKPINGSEGYIDTVNGKVGDVFTKYINNLTITGQLISILDPDEIAAIILHEVGHTYTFYYYLGHITISNLIITQAVRKALKVEDLNERKKIINQASDYLGIDKREYVPEGTLSAAPDYNSELKIETLMLNAFRRRHKSATGTDVYDLRSCEQLADQFSVRHGAGYALGTALDKMGKWQGGGNYSRVNVWLSRILTGLSLLMLGIATFGIVPLLILLATVGLSREKSYDDPEYRIRLIQQNMIDRLKTVTMSSAEKNKLIKQINELSEISKDHKEDDTISRAIAYALSKARANEMNTEKMQKYLEDMVFNKLFVNHSQLQSLGV